MDYISVKDAVRLWNVSERWVQVLCGEGRIAGVQRFGRSWMIPKDAGKPDDLRRGRAAGRRKGGRADV